MTHLDTIALALPLGALCLLALALAVLIGGPDE